jgi:predicted SprT family Zn-dependent metalloprotease
MEKRSAAGFVLAGTDAGEAGRLHLTPEALENAYEYLRATLPFRRMNLPHADNLVFRVMGARDRYGHFKGRIKDNSDLNEIGLSQTKVHSTDVLMATMAHEMIHLHQHEKGSCTRGVHNGQFQRIAARVCRIHGFDPETF